MKSSVPLLGVMLLGLLFCPRAEAQLTDDDRARGHFQAGQSYFDQGRYAESAQQFDEAYRLSQRPRLLANASLAYERAGDLENAVVRLEAYIASGAPEAEGTAVTAATHLEALRIQLEAERAAAAETSEEPETQDVAPPIDASEPTDGGHTLRVVGLSLGGVGVGLGVTSLVLGLRARSIHGELTDVCGPDGDACPPDRADDIDRGQRFSTIGTVSMIGAIATVAAGTTLFVLGSRGDDEAPAATAYIDVARGRVTLNALGRF